MVPAHGEEASATLGKQRAAGSRVEWEIREAGHPSLGNIRYAYIKKPVETPVGSSKVFSRAYVSCQRNTGRFAIELSNSKAPADPEGMQPATLPRLVCSRPGGGANSPLVQEELLASWEVNEKLGDALARGFRAFPLRECASIRVEQEVTLPPGWAQKTARVEFDIHPYGRELDAIFVSCGEVSAYAPGSAPAIASAPAKVAVATPPPAPAKPAVIAPAPAPKAAPPAPVAVPVAAPGWRTAKTLATGRTNLRAGPDTNASVIVMLPPGVAVLVQQVAGGEWWQAKSPGGARFEGYIRQDRLDFK